MNSFLQGAAPVCEDVLLALINNPGYSDWMINQVMNANTPLTDNVLIGLVNRTPALADWVIAGIMVDNTLLSQQVWDAINNHTPAYPNWVINSIQNADAGQAGLPATNNCDNGIANNPGTTSGSTPLTLKVRVGRNDRRG